MAGSAQLRGPCLFTTWGIPATVEATRHGGPRIIPGSRYLADEERWSFAMVAFVAGLASMGLILLAGIFVNEWLHGTLTVPVLIVSGVLLALCIWVAYTQSKRSIAEYEGFRKGREGEDAIAEKLQMKLDGQWTVFRNLVLPGDRKDDLDFVLVGPGGIWVLEVKTYGPRTRVGPDQPAGPAAKLRRGGWKTRSGPASGKQRRPPKQVARPARCRREVGERRATLPRVSSGRFHSNRREDGSLACCGDRRSAGCTCGCGSLLHSEDRAGGRGAVGIGQSHARQLVQSPMRHRLRPGTVGAPRMEQE